MSLLRTVTEHALSFVCAGGQAAWGGGQGSCRRAPLCGQPLHEGGKGEETAGQSNLCKCSQEMQAACLLIMHRLTSAVRVC